MKPSRLALVLAVVTGWTALAVMAPASAASPLIEASPSSVTVEVPAPGHSATWDMRVQNVSDMALPLSLSVEGEGAALFDGPSALEVAVVDGAGTEIVPNTAVGPLLGSRLQLADLPSGQSYELRGSVTLPESADNRYQGQSGSLTFVFTTITADPPLSPGPGNGVVNDVLAYTGANVLLIAFVAIVLLVVGVGLSILRKKRTIQ
ncbi:hypothetical protein AB4Y88_00075 [Paenarthrobacter sp. RAF9]